MSTIMQKVAGVECATEIDTMEVVDEDPAVDEDDEEKIAAVPVTTAEMLSISNLIIGHRVEDHVMKRRKTIGILENLISSQVYPLSLRHPPQGPEPRE